MNCFIHFGVFQSIWNKNSPNTIFSCERNFMSQSADNVKIRHMVSKLFSTIIDFAEYLCCQVKFHCNMCFGSKPIFWYFITTAQENRYCGRKNGFLLKFYIFSLIFTLHRFERRNSTNIIMFVRMEYFLVHVCLPLNGRKPNIWLRWQNLTFLNLLCTKCSILQ